MVDDMVDEPRVHKSGTPETPDGEPRPVWAQTVVGLLMGVAALAILYLLIVQLL